MIPRLELIADDFARISDTLPRLIEDLSPADLLWQATPGTNHIAWLAWHISRDEDAQMAVIAGGPEVYSDAWADRFALPYPVGATGYGQTIEEVRAFTPPTAALLVDYYQAVAVRSADILAHLDDRALDSLIDDPFRVTVATRLVSIVDDGHQHLGQIGLIRGMLTDRR